MDDLTRDVRPDAAATSRPVTRSPKRWPRFLIGVLVLVAVAAGGARYWLNARHFETTDDASIDAYTTQIASRVAGQVTKLLFADNQHVETGQTLLLIDPRDYQAGSIRSAASRPARRRPCSRLRRRSPCSRPPWTRLPPMSAWRKPIW